MINRKINQVLQVAVRNNRYPFSSHDEPPPTKLPSVKSTLINIYVKNKYGVVETAPARIGESLYQVIWRNNVHSFQFQRNCNGYDFTYRPHYRPHDNDTKGPVCGDCRVVLQDNWFNKVNEETDGFNKYEEQLLTTSALDLKSQTRLSCCIPIEAWMEGLTCTVDITPEQSQETIII